MLGALRGLEKRLLTLVPTVLPPHGIDQLIVVPVHREIVSGPIRPLSLVLPQPPLHPLTGFNC